MELKEFISNALTQIAGGVQEAIDNSYGKGYLVNPSTNNKISRAYTIHFDISIDAEKKGGVNIKVIGGSVSDKSANHISFDVDMTFPSSGQNDHPGRPTYE